MPIPKMTVPLPAPDARDMSDAGAPATSTVIVRRDPAGPPRSRRAPVLLAESTVSDASSPDAPRPVGVVRAPISLDRLIAAIEAALESEPAIH